MAGKPKALYGIQSKEAAKAYEAAREDLDRAGVELTGTVDGQLRQMAEWIEEAESCRNLIKGLRGKALEEDVPETRIRQIMRTKAAAELEARRILDALLLLPHRARGRPCKDPREDAEEEDDGWDSFDDDGGGDAS